MQDNNLIQLVELIERKHVDIAPNYSDYQKMALGIAEDCGEEGRVCYHRICRQSDSYNERDADYRYSNALRTSKGKVHIGTVFTMAENAGVKLPKGGNRATAKPTATKNVDKVKGDTSDKGERLQRKGEKVQSATVDDIKAFLADYQLRQNVISKKVEYRESETSAWKWIDDRMVNSLWCKFCAKGFRCSVSDVNNVIHSDYVKDYDPFKGYFDGLPEWTHDKPDYIEELADSVTLVDETPESRAYLHRCMKKWLVGMVAGALRNNYVNQYILTFLGKQGIYKSTFFNHLLPPELHDYFHAQLFKGKTDRDEQFTLAQNMLVSFEEFDNISPTEMNRLKGLTSVTHVDERQVYGRHVEHMVRHNSYAATGNNTRILNDLSGNRRWLVFNVESIRSPFEHPFNYEGIYSEAVALMNEGEANYVFTPDDNAEITEKNRDFETVCMEEELVMKYYRKPSEGENGTAMSATDIIARINVYVKDKLSAQKVGVVMKKLGYVQKKINGIKKYRVHVRTDDEIKCMEAQESCMFDSNLKEPEQQDLPF